MPMGHILGLGLMLQETNSLPLKFHHSEGHRWNKVALAAAAAYYTGSFPTVYPFPLISDLDSKNSWLTRDSPFNSIFSCLYFLFRLQNSSLKHKRDRCFLFCNRVLTVWPRLATNSWSSCLSILSAGIIDIYHHTWLKHGSHYIIALLKGIWWYPTSFRT
jgi:hypothetical protein